MEYDPLAPLALPLGPRSVAMRSQLAAEVFLIFLILCVFENETESFTLFIVAFAAHLGRPDG